MKKNPSAERMIGPSPSGALCLVVEVLLFLWSLQWLPSSAAYALFGHPFLSALASFWLALHNPVFALLVLVNVWRARRGRCWPLWLRTYCCAPGSVPAYLLLRER
ncbi:hypothetical protein [Ignicoccus hospitalis]|uniref:Uncharacterized protein n=1 Tax=Ignicoccus hospitalis (strain KIN4/I / DSM 18386 / JCM 14125) TaxID=453591 RepID=A8AAU6_IGNH4|nr:hypothetical protein [Ignicoccus hospitalis]ABU82048.1 hypothetical protein Igni_0866 [Ignicoccus hospitalis KIN4/I]HIH91005.1 hypothetical protein [Desulfurococcaceae archaeon]